MKELFIPRIKTFLFFICGLIAILCLYNFFLARENALKAEQTLLLVKESADNIIEQNITNARKIAEDLYINTYYYYNKKKSLDSLYKYLVSFNFPYINSYVKNIFAVLENRSKKDVKYFSLIENRILPLSLVEKTPLTDIFANDTVLGFEDVQFYNTSKVGNKEVFEDLIIVKKDYLDAYDKLFASFIVQIHFFDMNKSLFDLIKKISALWLIKSSDYVFSNFPDKDRENKFLAYIETLKRSKRPTIIEIEDSKYVADYFAINNNVFFILLKITSPRFFSIPIFALVSLYTITFIFLYFLIVKRKRKVSVLIDVKADKKEKEKTHESEKSESGKIDIINPVANEFTFQTNLQNILRDFLNLFDSFNNPVLIFDQHGNLLKINISAYRNFSVEEIENTIAREIYRTALTQLEIKKNASYNILYKNSLEQSNLLFGFFWEIGETQFEYVKPLNIIVCIGIYHCERCKIDECLNSDSFFVHFSSRLNYGFLLFRDSKLLFANDYAKNELKLDVGKIQNFLDLLPSPYNEMSIEKLKNEPSLELKRINIKDHENTFCDLQIIATEFNNEFIWIVFIEDKTLFYKSLQESMVSDVKLSAILKLENFVIFELDDDAKIIEDEFYVEGDNEYRSLKNLIVKNQKFIESFNEAKSFKRPCETTIHISEYNNKTFFVIIEPFLIDDRNFRYIAAAKDVSNLKRLDKEIQDLKNKIYEREAFLRGFYFEVEIRPEFRILYLSDEAYIILGIDKRDISFSTNKFIDSFQNEQLRKYFLLKDIVPINQILSFVSPFKTYDDKLLYFEIKLTAKILEIDENTKIELLSGCAFDITEYYVYKLKNDELDGKMSLLLENDLIGAIYYSISSQKIVHYNRKAQEVFSINENSHLYDLFDKEQLEKVESFETFLMIRENSNNADERFYYEVYPLKWNEKLSFGCIVILNVTQTKKAEENLIKYQENLERVVKERTFQLINANKSLLREFEKMKLIEKRLEVQLKILNDLINFTPLPIFLKKYNGSLIVANKEFFDFFEVGKENEIFREPLIFKHKLLSAIVNLESKLKIYNQTLEEEISFADSKGNLREAIINLIRIPEFERYSDVVLGVILDITKQKDAQKKIEEALKKEKELSELKSRFISTASHEFRTPLTAILSSAELIEMLIKKQNFQKALEHIKKIKNSVKQTADLMNDALFLNKAEMGRLTIKLEKINLLDFINELLDEVLLGDFSSRTVEVFIKEEIELISDKTLLRQILVNLIGNALKYSPENSKVVIYAKKLPQKSLIIIRDYGIGIPESSRPNLFQPFYRASNVEGIKGTGLGLAIVKKAVEELKGEIKFKSKLNFGTVFYVFLPINVERIYEQN